MNALAMTNLLALSASVLVGLITYIAGLACSVGRTSTLPVVRWRRRRVTGAGIGVICGAVMAAGWVWFSGADRGGSITWMLIVDAGVGGILGLVGGGFQSSRDAEQSVRVARSQHVAFTDYLHPAARWGVRTVGVLSLIAFIGSVMADFVIERVGAFMSAGIVVLFLLDPPVLMTLLGVVGWVLFEVRGRRAATISRTATSRDELVLDDHLRRQAILDLAWSATILGAAGVLFSMPVLYLAQAAGSQHSFDAFRWTTTVFLAVGALMLVLRPIYSRRQVASAPVRTTSGARR
ncbi:hypothetical protein [Curtobacterium sp. 24E2]|nr:hypothetical protein JN350_18505 [Curtobacterium sp. 24E2]